MTNNNDDNFLSDLIATGTLLIVGYGVYKVIKPLFSFEEGNTVTVAQLKEANRQIYYKESPPKKYEYCKECGEETERYFECGHCMKCNDPGGYDGLCYHCFDAVDGDCD